MNAEELNLINNPEFEVTQINPSGTDWAAQRQDTAVTAVTPRYELNETNGTNVGWHNTGQNVIEVWTPSFQNGQLGTNLGSNISEINSVDGNSQLYITFTAEYSFDYDFSWSDVNRPSGGADYKVNINTGTTPIDSSGTGNTFSDDYTATVSSFTSRSETVTIERGQTYTISYSTAFSSTLSSLTGEVNLLTPVNFVYWDTNGATAGLGGPSPNGTWNNSNSNWSDSADGTGPLSSFAANEVAVFSAGDDATGSYTVTKNGRTDVNGIVFEDGTPTIAHGGGGRIHFEATDGGEPFVNVASGVTATIETRITDQGSEGLVKFGDGTLVLGGSRSNSRISGDLTVDAGVLELANTAGNNQIRGNVIINGGTLLISEANQIQNSSDVTLNGGTIAIGETSERIDTLTLSSDSSIDFTGANGQLTFDDSTGATWDSGATITITNWNGANNGGGDDQLSFGTSGLTETQIGQIKFYNPTGLPAGIYDARMLTSGEVVPVVPIPEPGTYAFGGILAVFVGVSIWRRRKSSGRKPAPVVLGA
ncbi:hypothetical protein [Cerasicoccus maritimus]|uniref:hypothetical protein n=1 Tax=Cerasicoccus maritimus TaxID=490089 RepID=UPI002852CBED|nr:hypothetical protein [Cerasicoccus maritimus]